MLPLPLPLPRAASASLVLVLVLVVVLVLGGSCNFKTQEEGGTPERGLQLACVGGPRSRICLRVLHACQWRLPYDAAGTGASASQSQVISNFVLSLSYFWMQCFIFVYFE
jgi:hypothetical protein